MPLIIFTVYIFSISLYDRKAVLSIPRRLKFCEIKFTPITHAANATAFRGIQNARALLKL